jgi:pterin-4a-carbinolamine dehydratase
MSEPTAWLAFSFVRQSRCVSVDTHAIGGLSENDFILAAKINAAEK